MATKFKLKKSTTSNNAKTAPQPAALRPFVDKITISIRVPPSDKKKVAKAVEIATLNPAVFKQASPSAKFKFVQLIAWEGLDPKARPRFSYGRKASKLTIDGQLHFNPARIGPEGMLTLDKILATMFPGGWSYIEEHGRVSKIEVAVDVPDVRMHQFHVLPDRVTRWRTIKNEGKLKTVYNGKGQQLKVYSKSYHLWDKVHQRQVPKGPPLVRIEQRRKGVGLDLAELASLKNPLTGFNLVQQPPGPPPKEGGIL